jgi:hypothetical protein
LTEHQHKKRSLPTQSKSKLLVAQFSHLVGLSLACYFTTGESQRELSLVTGADQTVNKRLREQGIPFQVRPEKGEVRPRKAGEN